MLYQLSYASPLIYRITRVGWNTLIARPLLAVRIRLQNRHALACGPLHRVETRMLTHGGSVAARCSRGKVYIKPFRNVASMS